MGLPSDLQLYIQSEDFQKAITIGIQVCLRKNQVDQPSVEVRRWGLVQIDGDRFELFLPDPYDTAGLVKENNAAFLQLDDLCQHAVKDFLDSALLAAERTDEEHFAYATPSMLINLAEEPTAQGAVGQTQQTWHIDMTKLQCQYVVPMTTGSPPTLVSNVPPMSAEKAIEVLDIPQEAHRGFRNSNLFNSFLDLAYPKEVLDFHQSEMVPKEDFKVGNAIRFRGGRVHAGPATNGKFRVVMFFSGTPKFHNTPYNENQQYNSTNWLHELGLYAQSRKYATAYTLDNYDVAQCFTEPSVRERMDDLATKAAAFKKEIEKPSKASKNSTKNKGKRKSAEV
jgi:hypothetical protein